MGQSFYGDAEGSSEPKVSDFEISRFIDKKILRFKITMNNAARVAIVDSVDKLKKEKPDLISRNASFMLRHILFHVVVKKIKDQI